MAPADAETGAMRNLRRARMLREICTLKATVLAAYVLAAAGVAGLPTGVQAQQSPLEPLPADLAKTLGGDPRFVAIIDASGEIRVLSKYPMSELNVTDPIKATIDVESEPARIWEGPDYVLLYNSTVGSPAIVARRWSGGTVCRAVDTH
jgi:hypothetical protein